MMPLKWRYARARETSWHRLISVWKGKGVGEPSRNEVIEAGVHQLHEENWTVRSFVVRAQVLDDVGVFE